MYSHFIFKLWSTDSSQNAISFSDLAVVLSVALKGDLKEQAERNSFFLKFWNHLYL